MSSRTRRQLLRSLADDQKRAEAILAPRKLNDEISYPGVGIILVSVAYMPAFGTARQWEVRSCGNELLAYSSEAQQPGSRFVFGHTRLAVAHAVLDKWVSAFVGQTLPLAPTTGDFAVADANVFLAKFGMGFLTSCAISWCEGHEPESWKPVVENLVSLKNLLEAAQAIEQPVQPE